jgi:hypothetical protein
MDKRLLKQLDYEIGNLQQARKLIAGAGASASGRGGARPGAGRPKGSGNHRSSGRGGARPGAGRPKGSGNKSKSRS